MTWAVRKICSKNIWPRYLSYWHIGRHLDRVNSSNQSWEQRQIVATFAWVVMSGLYNTISISARIFYYQVSSNSIGGASFRKIHAWQPIAHQHHHARTQPSIAAPMCRPRPFCFAFFFPSTFSVHPLVRYSSTKTEPCKHVSSSYRRLLFHFAVERACSRRLSSPPS